MQIINRKKFATAGLNQTKNAFLVYKAYFVKTISIYPFKLFQIAFLRIE